MAHPYGTQAELENRLGPDLRRRLSEREGGNVANVLAAAREDADRLIDAALGQRYSVPFESAPDTPDVINTLSNMLAAANLLLWKFPQSELRTELEKKAAEILEALRTGDSEVGGSAVPVPSTSGASGLAYSGAEPVFAGLTSQGRDRTGGW
jgi:phage gp36-like protein